MCSITWVMRVYSGETDHLEQLVLDGRGQLLMDRKSNNPASVEFLRALIQYQVCSEMCTE